MTLSAVFTHEEIIKLKKLVNNERNDLSTKNKKILNRVVKEHYHDTCPCCGKTSKTWQYDHWEDRSITKLNSVWKVCRECNTKLGAAGDMTKRQPYKERFELFQRLVSWTVGVQGQLPIINKY